MCSLRVRATSVAVGRDDDRGVEAQAVVGVGALVERGVHVDAGLARQLGGERVRRAAGQRLGLGAARPAGPSGVIAKYGDSVSSCRQTSFAPSAGGQAHALGERGAVLVGVGVPALLHERRRAAARAWARSTRAGDAGRVVAR